MELIDLIYNKNYKEAKKRLKNPVGRTNSISETLIHTLEKMTTNGNVIRKDCEIDYVGSPFKKFFTSLKNKDYETSYYYSLFCEKIAKKSQEFTVYRYILEDILIANELNKLIRQKGLIDNLSKMKKLLENMPTFDDQESISHALELIEMLEQAKEQKITKNDFAKFICSKDIVGEFWQAIINGDYITALDINRKNCDKLYFTKRDQFLYTKLLTLFKARCVIKPFYRVEDKSKKITYLENLKKQIEQEEYQETYQYFLKQNLLDDDLIKAFKILKKSKKNSWK